MNINEVDDAGSGDLGASGCGNRREAVAKTTAKRALVGAGARVLFYPTLLYNVLRNKFQVEFRHVQFLRQLGVRAVVTLNEPYETFVPSSLYKAFAIDHLVIPTRDYLFAPSLVDIRRAVDFIRRNASSGWKTYVHCKAGRGRSTTIVLCYLVKYKNMTPSVAFEYVRRIRPRVLLGPSQWQRGAFQRSNQGTSQQPSCSVEANFIKSFHAYLQLWQLIEEEEEEEAKQILLKCQR